MTKPNVTTESVSGRFMAIQKHLRDVHELLDSIQEEPFIPSYRQDALAFLSDKVNNLQENVHTMAQQLSHLR